MPTVNKNPAPSLLFDYYGFPEHTYRLTYPVPGSPTVAARVRELLSDAHIPSAEEERRGLDHGIFIPFKLIYPEAQVPIVQLSLVEHLDPAAHLAVGRALRPLRDEGVLIAGSGMSFHNLRTFFADDPRASKPAEDFDAWLNDAVMDSASRAEKLTDGGKLQALCNVIRGRSTCSR